MKTSNSLTLTTSPPSQPARKLRETASLTRRQRPLYRRKRQHSTGKERDSETGLYYYGARYLDGRTGRWLSGDPAMGDYVPSAPVNDEARKRNQSLPGMGGVFNYVNLHVYHYAGNNPVKYVDPDGNITIKAKLNSPSTLFATLVTYTIIPYGGGYTDEQKAVNNITTAVGIGMGLLPLGNTGDISSAMFAIENNDTGDLISTGIGMAAEALKSSGNPILSTIGNGVKAANILGSFIYQIAKNNNLNITGNEANEAAKIAIEQSFIKDFSSALKEKGVTVAPPSKRGNFIMNFKAVDSYLSDVIRETVEQVKASNPLYKDVEINY